MRALARGAYVELQVLHALILREVKTRFGQSQMGYLWALLEPMLFIGTMAGFYALGGSNGRPGMTMIGFLATGIIPYQFFREAMSRVTVAVTANRPLLFYPQVEPLDLMLSRVILEGATWFTVFAIILGGEALWLGTLQIDDLLKVMLGLTLAGALGGALGAVVASLTVFSSSVERFTGALFRPLMFVSGTFFALEEVPYQVAQYMLWNPVLHAVELTRDGWFPGYTSRLVNAWYPLCWVVALSFIAVTLERVVRPRLDMS